LQLSKIKGFFVTRDFIPDPASKAGLLFNTFSFVNFQQSLAQIICVDDILILAEIRLSGK
jgi:hypothetical protein